MTLKEAGHFKTTANTIETALSELKHNRIDTTRLDLNLPDGHGTQLARLGIFFASNGLASRHPIMAGKH